MNKKWWTIDRIAMLIGLAVTLFGWGVTWGSLGGKVNTLEAENSKKDIKIEKLEDENNDQEIKISLNADAVDGVNDVLWNLVFGSRSAEEEGQE